MKKTKRKFDSFQFLTLLFLVFIVLAVVMVLLEAQKAHYILQHAKWYFIFFGVVFSFVSYFFSSLAYLFIASIFSINVHKKEIFLIGFVTIPVGALLDIGGIGGNSIRVAYLRNFGIKSINNLVLSSFFFTYCVFLGILFFVPIGFFWLFLEKLINPELKSVAKLILEISVGTLFITTVIFFVSSVREFILKIFSKSIFLITRKEIYHRLDSINNALHQGTRGFIEKPKSSFKVIVSIVVSWLFAFLTLWMCFLAFGIHTQFGVLVIGFALGILAGLFTPIPGGIGIQDTSMAGIFALFGIPLHDAIFVAIAFRITYYLIPAGAGLLGYYVLIKRLKKKLKK